MKTRKKIAFKIFQWLITAMVALIILIPNILDIYILN